MSTTIRHIFTLHIQSSLKSIRRLSAFLKKANTVINLSENDFYRLHLCATEAVNNAILHGNNLDEKKVVEIRCEVKKTVLILSVSDFGNGFIVNAIPNPLRGKNKLKSGGRGIFLMKALMDSIESRRTKTGSVTILKMRL